MNHADAGSGRLWTRERSHKLRIAVGVVAPLIGFLVAVYLSWNRYVFASDLWLLAAMYFITGIGETIGFHRMLTHDGFKTYAPIRAAFLILGCMAFPGSRPDEWAATHIKHHAHSDEEEDPHSPLHGLWHAHLGWVFSTDHFDDVEKYAPHFKQDRVLQFVCRAVPLWAALSFAIPFALGGWTGLLWGGFVRLFLTEHITASVNSVCHAFGRREFETSDESRNEWVVGLLAFGEGWHNNHHAFPKNAFHGLRWWQFDLSGLIIRFLEKAGLVWEVQRVSSETMEEHRKRTETMLTSLQTLRTQVLQSIAGASDELERLFSRSIGVSISSEEYARLRELHAQASERLLTIRASIARAQHLKRPRLIRYMGEVQELQNKIHQVIGEMRQPVSA